MSQKAEKKGANKPVDYAKLMVALKQVKINQVSVRGAAVDAGTSRTSFRRYLQRVNEKFPDLVTVSDADLLDFLEDKAATGGKTVNKSFFFCQATNDFGNCFSIDF